MYGSDQSASINGEELSHLIEQISRVKSIMGNGEKTFSDAEKTVADKLRYF